MNTERYTVCIKRNEKTNLLKATINNADNLSLIFEVPGEFKTEQEVYANVAVWTETIFKKNS